jgi:oligopeptide transport system substrate-binding protein
MRYLILVCAVLVSFACSCNKQPPKTADGTNKAVSPQLNTPAAIPAEYRFPLPADPMTLDPAHITDTVSDSVARRIYNQLVRFAPDLSIIDDLAESHTISPDGLQYTFVLRKGVKFHNGRELTADDVAYSYRRLLDPATNAERANLLYYVQGAKEFHESKAKDIPGIVVVDPATIKLVLVQPYAPFLNALCMTTFGVVPKEAVEKPAAAFSDNPVGTGPFVFESWQKGDKITLKANDSYFKTAPSIKTLIFRIITDEKTRFENFKAGALEHCDIPPSQMQEVKADPQLSAEIQGVAAMDMYAYGFNCEKAPFKDNTALRQALNYAVDKGNIINNIWGGLVTEQKTCVPEGMFYFQKDAPGYPYNIEKAKQLLADSGYPDGKGLPELVLNVDLQPTNRLVAQAVQEDLRKIGVNVRIETTDWGPFLEKVYAGEALFFQNTWLTDYPDPDNWLFQLLHSSNFGEKGNICRWRNAEFDQLVSQAQVTVDQTSRADMYKRAEEIALKEAPWLLLFWRNNATLVQPYVQGLELTRMDRTPQLGNTPLEQVRLEAPGSEPSRPEKPTQAAGHGAAG